jgi:hypothetical protein
MIKSVRLLGLSNRFTKDLFTAILDETQRPFNQREYNKNVNEIYSEYETKQLLKLCTSYCKIS